MNISEPKKRNPRVIIRKIPASWTDEKIEAEIRNKLQIVRVVKFLRSLRKDISYCACVIEVTPEVRSQVVEQGFISIGWRSCTVSDHFHLIQCFACCGFGHKKDECKKPPVCAYCADGQLSSDCPNSENDALVCVNCWKRGLYHDHSAGDHYRCGSVKLIQQHLFNDQSKN